MKDVFIVPIFLYGIEYILAVMALLAVGIAVFAMRRRYVMALLFAGVLLAAAGAVPLYRDTVLRAQDADAAVVRLLWGRAYPGVFRLTAEGEPGLPPFAAATWARAVEALPATPDWMAFSDACLRLVEGREGDRRRFDMTLMTGGMAAMHERPECRTAESVRAAFGIDITDLLRGEYARLRAYAAKVEQSDRSAQENCPPFYSDRGRYQKRELNKRTGMMENPYDLSGIKCACVALGRHQGCQALSARDRAEGYVADLKRYGFFTPLTCDQSELCTVMRPFVMLENEAPDVPAGEKDALIARATAQCVATGQFSPERRQALCGCSMALLVGQAPEYTRLGQDAARCLVEKGFLDDGGCVIGEADWNAQREAVSACMVSEGL